MQNEQSNYEAIGVFTTLNSYIDTIKESSDSEYQINSILILLKSIVELLEAVSNVSSSQSAMLNSLNKSSQAMTNVANELDEKTSTINSNLIDLAKEVSRLAKLTSKIPTAINVDNLIKTINEHTDEINENTASIKEIKEIMNYK